MKKRYEKIAVFDLDGTLYKGNSHIEIISQYYCSWIVKNIIFIAIGVMFPSIQLKILYALYNRIPDRYKKEFLLEFNYKTVNLLQKKISEGYYPLIISAAPIELINKPANILGIDYCKSYANEKSITLEELYSYKFLFVCTDNKSDIDILELADEAVIITKDRNKDYYTKKLKKLKKYEFWPYV